MKILLVNDYATPTAGAEIMTLALRDALRARDQEVCTFASRAQLIDGSSFADTTCYGTTSRFQALSSTFNVSARRHLARTIEEFGPDLVHVRMFLWQLSPSILSVLRRVPAIYHIVTYKAICPTGSKILPNGRPCERPAGLACLQSGCLTPQSWAAMMAQHYLWWRGRGAFDRFVTVSEGMREKLAAGGVGPCDVIPNGCPTRPARAALAGGPVIAYAGRLVREKGVDILIGAFECLLREAPKTRLWIAGDGPEAAGLKNLARKLGVWNRVEFLGPLDRDEVERRFDEAWVQVVPSVWDEPFGTVAIEAMMRGTAVVATDRGGLRVSVRHGYTGLLIPHGDKKGLADALVRLASDRELCEAMGAAGRRVALREYRLDDYCARVLSLYEEVVAGARRLGKNVEQSTY